LIDPFDPSYGLVRLLCYSESLQRQP